MKILISVPSGFHSRELLLPLKPLLEQDPSITNVICLTPGARYRQQIFSSYGQKFDFVANPTPEQHRQLLAELEPNLVITTTAGLDERDLPILSAATQLKIPTLTFIASWDNVWKMERFLSHNKKQVLADHLVVWNKMMEQHLLRIFPQQLSPARIHVLGAPRLDYFFHHDQIPSKEELLTHLGFSDTSKKLIHLATTELYPMDYVARTVNRAMHAGKIPAAHLLATVHPGGDLKKHQSLTQYGVRVRYAFGRRQDAPHSNFRYNPTLQDIYLSVALFTHADLLINHSSTVALESFLGGTPVINVRYGKTLDWWRWYRSMVYRDFEQHYRDLIEDGATSVVKNSTQLVKATSRYLKNPEHDETQRQHTLEKMITTVDGTATKKFFALIKKILRP